MDPDGGPVGVHSRCRIGSERYVRSELSSVGAEVGHAEVCVTRSCTRACTWDERACASAVGARACTWDERASAAGVSLRTRARDGDLRATRSCVRAVRGVDTRRRTRIGESRHGRGTQ